MISKIKPYFFPVAAVSALVITLQGSFSSSPASLKDVVESTPPTSTIRPNDSIESLPLLLPPPPPSPTSVPRKIVLVDTSLGRHPWLAELKKNGATEIVNVYTKHIGLCADGLERNLKLCNDIGLEYKCFDWKMIRPSGNHREEFKALAPFEGVISGHEPSTEIADQVSLMLDLDTTNCPAKSAARKEKLLMQQTLAEAGLKHIDSFFATNSDMALKYIEQNLTFPILLKPDRSGASVGVNICNNAKEVQAAFDEWIGADLAQKSGYFGLTGIVEGLVVQEFLTGQEFVVNIVSRDGKHVVTDMWKKYNTEDQECIYDKEILCNNSKDHSDIVDYVVDVFDALGIRHGPSHVEVMLTADGPCLIEVGCRISGGCGAENESVPLTTIAAIAEAYMQPDKFKLRPLHYQALEAKAVVFLVAPKDPFINFKVLASLVALPSFSYLWQGSIRGFCSKVPENKAIITNTGWDNASRIKRTVDLFTTPGRLIFAHNSQEQVDADVKKAQDLKYTVFSKEIPSKCYALWMRGKVEPTTDDEKLICDCQKWTHWMKYDMYSKVYQDQVVLNFTMKAKPTIVEQT